jgi:hypothetical protein
MTTPDNGPDGRLRGGASQGDGCRAVPLNLLISGVARKPSGKKITTQVLEGGLQGPHQSPFALNRSHLGSLQLCSHHLESLVTTVVVPGFFGVLLSGSVT